MSYCYFMYGLYFESDIQLYQSGEITLSSYHRPDVFIRLSDHFLDERNLLDTYNLFFSVGKIMFKTEQGVFLIEEGRNIFVSPNEGAANSLISAFIVGWCMSYLMLQRNKLGIHSSALCYKGGSFLISGDSGAGKSTTAMNLIKKGYEYLTDDISFVSSDDGFMVLPGLPIQKICRNMAEMIDDKGKLIYVDEMKDKYALIDKEHFCDSEEKLSLFFLLESYDSPKVEHELIDGFDKVSVLLRSLFLFSTFVETGFPVSVKSECLKLAGNIRMIRIRRPNGVDTIDEVSDIIERYLEEVCQQ